jgi:clan AA aspartic protease
MRIAAITLSPFAFKVKKRYSMLMREAVMGTVYAEITLRNAIDVGMLEKGIIKEQDVHQTTVMAIVDTGAGTLVINEEICQKLGLTIKGLRNATFANDMKQACKVTAPVEIQWKERMSACHALVVPGSDEVLLGAIPLEDMDLMVNPARRELIGAHGDEIVCLVK